MNEIETISDEQLLARYDRFCRAKERGISLGATCSQMEPLERGLLILTNEMDRRTRFLAETKEVM